MSTTAATPRDAATVLLLRDARDRDGIETYLIRRHGHSSFMAGAFVFPGGKVDASDAAPDVAQHVSGRSSTEAARALAEVEHPSLAMALFVAAARETFEEAGVLLADVPDPSLLPSARDRLRGGVSFAQVLSDLGAVLRLEELVPHSRWITPEVEPRRYDTRFFLARAPHDQEASRDDRETTDALWIDPARAVELQRAGRMRLPPPTLRMLALLCAHRNVNHALAAVRGRLPPLVEPVVRDIGGQLAICLPGDPEHPEQEPVLEGATRLVLSQGRWWADDAGA